uniref:Uncharacterized protein n=1 Tax=Helianthus annuus TaxID=4232 RepID=A0A251VHQ9_HELAN
MENIGVGSFFIDWGYLLKGGCNLGSSVRSSAGELVLRHKTCQELALGERFIICALRGL